MIVDLRVVYPPDIKAGVAALRHARAAYGSNEEAVARAVYNAMRNDERADLRAVLEAEGAVVVGEKTIEWRDNHGGYAEEVLDYEVDRRKPGTYLVWRIEEVDSE